MLRKLHRGHRRLSPVVPTAAAHAVAAARGAGPGHGLSATDAAVTAAREKRHHSRLEDAGRHRVTTDGVESCLQTEVYNKLER